MSETATLEQCIESGESSLTKNDEPKKLEEPSLSNESAELIEAWKAHMEIGLKNLTEFKNHELGKIVYERMDSVISKSKDAFMPLDEWFKFYHIGLGTLGALVAKDNITHGRKGDIDVTTASNMMMNLYRKSHLSKITDLMLSEMRRDPQLQECIKKLAESYGLLEKLMTPGTEESQSKEVYEHIYKELAGMSDTIKSCIGVHFSKHMSFYPAEMREIYISACTRILCKDDVFMSMVEDWYPVFVFEQFDGTIWMMINFIILSVNPAELVKWEKQTKAWYDDAISQNLGDREHVEAKAKATEVK